jgi:TP901 family phage tail tape measure protein
MATFGAAMAQAFVRLRVDSSAVAADTSKGIEEGAGSADVEQAGTSAGTKAASAFSKAFKVGVLGAIAIVAASVATAVDFQTQMTKIQTQAGASASQVKQLSQQVLQLAPSTQQGPLQLAEALYHLKSVGMDDATAMKDLKTASDLAATGGSNLEQTTNALAAAWRSGIKGAQNFGTAAATVNAIVGAGNMTMSQLVGALSTGILSAANTFGVSMVQVGGALALMTDEGVPAQLAATRLRMSLSLLGAPSVTASKQLASIGLSSTSLAQALRSGGLIGAIGLLKQHIQDAGLSAVQTSQLLSRAFGGGESSSAILTMVNNFATLKRKQDQINAGISRYGADVQAQRQTVQAQLDLLKSSFETLGIRIGAALLPPVTRFVTFLAGTVVPKVAGFVQQVLQLLGLAPKAAPPGINRSAGTPAVTPMLSSVAATTIAMKGGLTGQTGTAAQLNPASYTQPAAAQAKQQAARTGTQIVNSIVDALVRGAGKIGQALITMLGKIDWGSLGNMAVHAAIPFIVEFVNNFINAVVDEAIHHPLDLLMFITALIPLGKVADITEKLFGEIPILGPLVKAITKPLVKVGELVEKPLFGLLKKIFGPLGDIIVTSAKDGLETAWTWLFVKGDDLIGGLLDGAREKLGGVLSWFGRIGSRVISAVGDLAEKLLKPGIDLIKGLLDGAKGKWGDAAALFKGIPGKILEFFTGSSKLLDKAGTDLIKGLLDGAEAREPGVMSWLRSIPSKIISIFADAGSWLLDAGKKLIGGLISGITSKLGGIGHAMGSIGSLIKSFLPFSPAKQGPLSGKGDPYYSGLSIGKKLAAGITATLPVLKNAVSGTLAQINSALSQAATEQKSGTSQLGKLTSHYNSLEAARKKEEASIEKLVQERSAEYKKEGAASDALRAQQELEIKSLEKLRSTQETQVKQTEAVIKTLRASLTKLKDEVDKLKEAAKKAAASSGSSSSDDGSSDDQPPDWANFNQWLAETGPAGPGGPAAGGSWQGNPGPLGGFGLAFDQDGRPRPSGRFDGPPPGFGRQGGDPLMAMLIDRMDQVVSTLRTQPGKNAAATASAMNGVAGTAIVRGNW